jgi:hypothetical protein
LVIVLQVMVPVQSAFFWHVLRQVGLGELQTYEPHEDVLAAGHAPAPSQVAAMVWTLPVQLSGRQPVEFDLGLQAPLPLQVPSYLQ